MGNNFLIGKVIGKLQNILPETEGVSSYFLQECAEGGKKKKEDRRQFCIFQGTSVKGYENSGVLFESADVLLSSLQSSTAPHRYHKCNGLNHPCFSFLGSLLRHSTLLLNNQS